MTSDRWRQGPLTGPLVKAMNEACADIAMSTARAEELTIELDQFRAGIEAVAAKVTFDADPSDFRATLLALAEQTPA
jgi:hypothetical protein